MKLLIVGNEVESRAGIEKLFIDMGHLVTATDDLQQAYKSIREDEEIVSLYIDWTVSEKEGLALCQKVRNLHRQPYFPIIIIISPEDREIIPRALNAGADSFLVKPLDKTFLAAQLKVIGHIQKLEDDLLELNTNLEQKVKHRTRELAIAYEKLQKANRDLVIAYENLRDTNQEIANIDNMKTAFIDVTAHELRTPLTTIVGALYLLNDKYVQVSADNAKLLEISMRAAQRLTDKIDKAIQFAYQSQYERALEKEPTHVKELITDVMHEVMVFANRRNQHIQTVLSDDFPPIQIDRGKIFDVLINLLMNAIKFTPNGGQIVLTVNWRDEGTLEFSVEDTGIGISEEDKPYIFKGFYTSLQTDDHSSGDFEFGVRGLGLGLAVAKKFVEMHGGEIGIKSTSTSGSCIYFTIPLAKPKTSAG